MEAQASRHDSATLYMFDPTRAESGGTGRVTWGGLGDWVGSAMKGAQKAMFAQSHQSNDGGRVTPRKSCVSFWFHMQNGGKGCRMESKQELQMESMQE